MQYVSPIASEIARLIVGNLGMYDRYHDIIVEHKDKKLKRISVLHPNLMSMQYLLLFTYGEDGYQIDINYVNLDSTKATNRRFITMREYYAYRLQQRSLEGKMLSMEEDCFNNLLLMHFHVSKKSIYFLFVVINGTFGQRYIHKLEMHF